MKKIYAKFTKERDPRFQIETAIYEGDDGRRVVKKHPLTRECEGHLARICRVYREYQDQGIQLFAPVSMEGDSIVFPFVKGRSYYDALLDGVKEKSRNEMEEVLADYRERVQELCPDPQPFQADDTFREIFGKALGDRELECLRGLDAVKGLDIDLTFDNMIRTEEGKVQIIDYEWMFPCLVPVHFAVYRALYAFCLKNYKQFSGIIEEEELYSSLGITKEERKAYKAMNDSFMSYVNGGVDSYEEMLKAYEKPIFTQQDGQQDVPRYAMAFVNVGHGYSVEENSRVFDIEKYQKTVKLHVDLTVYENVQAVRIDPLNLSAVIRITKFEAVVSGEVRQLKMDSLRHNALRGEEGIWLFDNEDPQIIVDFQPQEQPESLDIEFEILLYELEEYSCYTKTMKDNLQVSLQVQGQQKRQIEEQTLRIQELERMLTLAKDKLAYIENTKAYRLLLQKKVGEIRLWDGLNNPHV